MHKRTRYYSPSLSLFRFLSHGGRNCSHFQTNLHFTNKIILFTKICLYIFLVKTHPVYYFPPPLFASGVGLEKNAVFGGPKREKEESWGHGDKTTTKEERRKEGRHYAVSKRANERAVTETHGQKIPRPLGPPPLRFLVLSKSIGDSAKTPSVAGRCTVRSGRQAMLLCTLIS